MTGQHYMEEHLSEAAMENVLFLMDTGMSYELACLQIGRHPDTVERMFLRHGKPNPRVTVDTT